MKISVRLLVLCVALSMVAQKATYAHFKLLEPASWLVESDRGDPQKAGPCGGSNTDWGKPSLASTKAVGGPQLHLKIQETISTQIITVWRWRSIRRPSCRSILKRRETEKVAVVAAIQSPPRSRSSTITTMHTERRPAR
jgi:hypothetical protein